MSVSVEFWGVRGSIPVSSSSYNLFGGHTSCVSITYKEQLFIFDAGSGLRDLGEKIKLLGIKQATLILSHFHFDHIIGLPFFAPLWDQDFHLTLVSAHCYNKEGLKSFLENYIFKEPLFPVNLNDIQARITYIDCLPTEKLTLLQDCYLHVEPLNHPGGGYGYRFHCLEEISISYISDTEHLQGQDDLSVLKLMQGADLVIYDAMYTDEEFPHKKGWGHSTWSEGLRLAQKAGVKKLALFHHDPSRTDSILGDIEKEAQKIWPHCFMARQGMKILLS